MDDYLNKDIIDFNNDASASSFGWNFQANAGIFLFLKYIKDAKSIKIESKIQDIEIEMNDGSYIYAQAKSSQDYTKIQYKKDRFKDAIISLCKVPKNNSKLIYISNIPETLESAKYDFDNCIRDYNALQERTKNEIKEVLGSINIGIDKKIAKEKNKKIKQKQIKIKECIDSFPLDNLSISTINPYYGSGNERYQKIEDEIINFLSNNIDLSRLQINIIKGKLLGYWQNYFQHNSTIKDGEINKKITKEDFSWAIVLFDIGDELKDIDKSLSFIADNSMKQDAEMILMKPEVIYFNRFEFINKILKDYKIYKDKNIGNNKKEPEMEFIKEYAQNYYYEFEGFCNDDKQLLEYITKQFVYKIILQNRDINKISLAIGTKI